MLRLANSWKHSSELEDIFRYKQRYIFKLEKGVTKI